MAKFFGRMFVWIGCCFVVFGVYDSTSALTYQEEIPVSFTFNRGLSLTVSASDLHIYNLVPGNSDESNIITVTTTSNNATGYVLTASVGNSTKNTTNLVNGSNNFASIATNASQSSLTTDNTWGYSISTNNGSSWSNYSGLPIFSSTTWKEIASTNANGTTSILFKIGAKASSSQAAGDYTNVINFTATTNYAPTTIADLTYMQDFASLDSTEKANVLSSMTTGTQYQLADNRDNKTYFVSKLADGNVWMTQNLDFDIDSSKTYTSANTDLEANTTWTPSRSTYTYSSNTWCTSGNSSRGECFENYTPESIDLGDRYWNGEMVNEYSCTDDYEECVILNTASSGDLHYHIGNFYNYTAMYAANDTSNYGSSVVVINHSICPAGWKLPSSSEYSSLDSGSYLSFFDAPVFFNPFGVFDGESGFLAYPSIGYKAIYGVSDYTTIPISSSGIDASYNLGGRGVTIRCIAR